MKILFAGTPAIAVPSLRFLAERFPIAGVLTAPDKASGRGRHLTPSEVKSAAMELNLPVLDPLRLDSAARAAIKKLKPDLLTVFAYGKIFGPKFLSLFPEGAINMHPSKLPLYRGPAPLAAAILAGESETALTVQKIALETDSGDILRQTPLEILPTDTTGTLSEKAALLAGRELATVIEALATGSIQSRAQDHSKAVYCRLITKQDGMIDWNKSAHEIERTVRAYQPWPKAYTIFNGQNLAILESHTVSDDKPKSYSPGSILGVDKGHGILIQTGDGVLAITRLQAQARKPMDFQSFCCGMRLEKGMILG
ncbi:MAG: methionyl-tRNA formyltransferase [Spirochaeta sp. LUC14_002_19_P3]|nr:MAG: methionyl-tRNA formyltransferase [Spirochaeta sp. LUC14_002_19_P3]